jgi:diguanylate cyclase (GGDEF)-like protein
LPLHALAEVLGPANHAELESRSADLDRRIFDMEALLKAVEALHNELNLEALCTLLVAMACERLQVTEVALLLHDEEGRRMIVATQEGLDEEAWDVTLPAVDGILWRLLLAGDPFSILDLRGEPRFADAFLRNDIARLRGRVWLPLVMPDKVVGVLSLGSSRRAPTDADLHFLRHFASQAAVAINTARLYQSIDVARRQLDRSLHKLSMLFDVTRALGAVQDLTRLLRMILERAIAAVEAEKGSLMLVDEATDELVVRVVFGLPDRDVEQRINDGELQCTRFKRGEGIAGRVLDSGEPLRVDDVDKNDGFARREDSHNVHSLLCVPLKVDDETIGVINITNRKSGGVFGREDLEILGALANQAAVAIARTRLYEAAITDGLTGLFVRRFAMHRLGEEVRRSRRYGNELSVLMCDIDHFKEVNDTFGHQAGDEVIRAVATTIQSALRIDVDVAGRYGGEEFLILLPYTDGEAAAVCAERIRAALECLSIPVGGGRAISKTLSVGVARLCPDETAESVVHRADSALYASKREGRNRVTIAPE